MVIVRLFRFLDVAVWVYCLFDLVVGGFLIFCLVSVSVNVWSPFFCWWLFPGGWCVVFLVSVGVGCCVRRGISCFSCCESR